LRVLQAAVAFIKSLPVTAPYKSLLAYSCADRYSLINLCKN